MCRPPLHQRNSDSSPTSTVTMVWEPTLSHLPPLVNPKDKTSDLKKCGVVYEITCADCHEKYIGETSRNLGPRLKEHSNLKACTISAVGEHCANHQHVFDRDNVRVIAREDELEISSKAPHSKSRLWLAIYFNFILEAVVSDLWPLCVTASAEGCLGACTVFLYVRICRLQICTYKDGPRSEIINIFIMGVDP